MPSLIAYVVGLLGTFTLTLGGLVYIMVTIGNRRYPGPLRVPTGVLSGYIAGVLFVWTLVPRDWTLPFWTTLAASVNAAKYGHPVEHYAQGIVVAMMFCGVAGAAVGGSATHIAGHLLRQRRIRQAH